MKPANLPRWKSVPVLAIILIAGLVAICLFIGKVQERKEFVSKAVSGYRCRFTLPADWSRRELDPPAGYSGPVHMAYEFTTPRLDPVQEWLHRRLFPPAPPIIDPTMNTATNLPWRMQIDLIILAGNDLDSLKEGDPGPGERIVTQRQVTIDGCSLTILRKEWISPLERRPLMWLAYTPDHSVLFEATSRADIHDHDRMDHEMETILSSLHIEKITGPTGNKR